MVLRVDIRGVCEGKTFPMKVLVISSSLNPGSRSRLMARFVKAKFEAESDLQVDWVDLQETALPFCDGGAAYGDANVIELSQRMEEADAFVLATPIYNFDANSALKNLVELVGRKMENKLVGILASAGGAMSYMSPMALANSLMLDFRTVILPRFVYATGSDWDGDNAKAPIAERLEQFAAHFLDLGRKLSQ